MSAFQSEDNFADAIVDEKISISDYPLSASVGNNYSHALELLTFNVGCLWEILLCLGRIVGHRLIFVSIRTSKNLY